MIVTHVRPLGPDIINAANAVALRRPFNTAAVAIRWRSRWAV